MDQDEAMFGAEVKPKKKINLTKYFACLLNTTPSPRDTTT